LTENVFYVYLLIDPRNNKSFYVGKGCGNRIYDHVKEAQRSSKNSYKLNKIRKIMNLGLDINYEKVFRTNIEAKALEYEIKIIKEIGLDNLCNITPGGKNNSLYGEDNGMYGVHRYGKDNPFYGRKHTKQTKQKIREVNTGRKYSIETNKKKGSPGEKNPMYGTHRNGEENPFYGRKHTKEAKIKISKSKKGRSLSEGWRQKIGESVKKSKAKAKFNPEYWSEENKLKRKEHSKRSWQTYLNKRQEKL